MASTHPDFPLLQWCKLVEQGNINLKLLRPSRINPKLSSYAQVFGAFYYQKTLFPPPGMKVLSHVLPINRCFFDPYTIKGFSVGVAMENYCWSKIFISSTVTVCIDDTIRWFTHGSLNLPILSKDELLCSSIYDLRTTLQLSVKNNILPPEGTTSRITLLDLNANFTNWDRHDPPIKPTAPSNVPRVKFQSKDPTIVPRVKLHSNGTTRVPRVQPPAATLSTQPTLRKYKRICDLSNPIVFHDANLTIHLWVLKEKFIFEMMNINSVI